VKWERGTLPFIEPRNFGHAGKRPVAGFGNHPFRTHLLQILPPSSSLSTKRCSRPSSGSQHLASPLALASSPSRNDRSSPVSLSRDFLLLQPRTDPTNPPHPRRLTLGLDSVLRTNLQTLPVMFSLLDSLGALAISSICGSNAPTS